MSKTVETSRKITFSKVYKFEGKEYTEVDLSELDNLTTRQLGEVSKQFSTSEYITPAPEADINFCCMVAAKACSLPIEFFNNLPARDGVKVRIEVQTFFREMD